MRPCRKVLHSLSGDDHFNLLMFNSKVTAFQPALSGATPVSLQKATDFVRANRLRGGTDLQRALEAGLAQCAAGFGQQLSGSADRRLRHARLQS